MPTPDNLKKQEGTLETPELRTERAKLPPPLDMKELFEKAKNLSPEIVREKVNKLNTRIRFGDQTHEIEVAVDPTINTWACARIPKQKVQTDGTIINTSYHHYIIVMPYPHLAIDDENFILGELRHELGHALYTDWQMNERLGEIAKKQGYNQSQMHSLLNCIEDPRMEHVSTLPVRLQGYIRNWFWAKNKKLILGNIGEGIAKSHPVDQFNFLIKLYSLWAIHKNQADEENIEPWDDIASLNPSVQREWELVKETVERITGINNFRMPEMRSGEIEKAVSDILWPAKKRLIDEFGESSEQQEQEPGKGEEGKEGQKGKEGEPGPDGEPGHGGYGGGYGGGEEGEEGQEGQGGEGTGDPSPDKPPQNPDNIDNLPPEVQKFINQQIENYNQQIQNQQKQQIETNQKIEQANKKIEEEKQKRLEKQDGMRDPELRKKYNHLKKEAAVFQNHMRKLFEKYFPKITYPRDIYGRKGREYSAREHLKRFGSGMEKPMATPNIPEKSGFVLQIIVDISGSMQGARINEAVKTVIGMLEAAEDYPIYIEILASDDKHGGIKPEYILKSFDEEFSGGSGGKIKERLVKIMDMCHSGNQDDESLKWAVPRIVKKKNELRSQYENISALTVFLSDAEIPGQQDPKVVEEMRKKVPVVGGCVEPSSAIKASVQAAYGPDGEGSFCPDSLANLPRAFEKVLRKKIRGMFSQK